MLAEFDEIQLVIYDLETNDPDKYVGLLGNNNFSTFTDKELVKSRKVQARVDLQQTPYCYQYFHERLKHINSQYDQDGVIEAIFDLIGTRDKFFIEIGGGNTIDNTYLLRYKKGWNGILFNSGRWVQLKDDPFLIQ